LLNIAVCYDALGRPREAVAAFERAFAVGPERSTAVGGDINRIYGFSYLRLRDSARARAEFERMLDGDVNHQGSGHRSLALYEMYYGRYGRAIDHLRDAVRALPGGITEFRNRLYLAAAYRAKGQAASADAQLAALADLQRSTRIPPAYLAFLGRQLARDGRLLEATEVLDSMTARMDPKRDRGVVELVRGEIALARGDAAAALDALDLASTLIPYTYAQAALAGAQAEAGQWDRAVTTYQKVLRDSAIGWEVQEPWIMASYELGRLYESRGDTAHAVDLYQRFVERWATGDEDLPVLADARSRLRALARSAVRAR
jgi:tetratricopeptide (TPR) repeat protein